MQATIPRLAIERKANLPADWAACRSRPPRRPALTDLGPLAQLRAGRLGRRLPQLYVGLVLYGVSLAMMVRGDLGLAPWDVLHSGLIGYVPLTHRAGDRGDELRGAAAVDPAAGGAGLGTISNALVIGSRSTRRSRCSTRRTALWRARIALLVGGVLLNGLATALYIGSQFGRGPRDGLMTGLTVVPAGRCGWSAPASRSPSCCSGCSSAAWSASGRCSTRWPSARDPGAAAALHRPAHPSSPQPPERCPSSAPGNERLRPGTGFMVGGPKGQVGHVGDRR